MIAVLTAAVMAVGSVVGGSATTEFTSLSKPVPVRAGKPCRKLWTGPTARRAILTAYHGTRTLKRRDRVYLATIIRCQQDPAVTSRLLKYEKRLRHAWWLRLHPTMYQQRASWYNDGGSTACGFHAFYGVANKSLPCGTHVLVRYGGRQLTMIVQDRGPYVGGRVWDLNQNTAAALGFAGVDMIWVSVPG